MTRVCWAVGGICALLLSFCTVANAQKPPEKPKPTIDFINLARQTYIFQLAPDTSPAEVRRIAREVAQISGQPPGHVYKAVMRGFSARVSDADLVEIQEEIPEIVGIQRSNIFTISKKPLDKPGKNPSDGESGSAETIPWGVAKVLPIINNETDVQNCEDPKDSCTTIYVLDTGVDVDHPDLNFNKAKSKNCVTQGKNTYNDKHGHGTHVAGTAAAKDNDGDVVGVAAGAWVASVRVLNDRGWGTTADVICGIDYVADKGSSGDVANMSLSGLGDTMIDTAVVNAAEKGILFSVAAGNSSNNAALYSPARVNHPNVYTVSATDISDNFASFSNYGSPVDIAAPGVNILSLKIGGGTMFGSGTSMSAPHVSGLLSLKGTVKSCGTAIGDPDGNADGIAYLAGYSCPSPGS